MISVVYLAIQEQCKQIDKELICQTGSLVTEAEFYARIYIRIHLRRIKVHARAHMVHSTLDFTIKV